jgi:type VI secretion system secreted protein VgrG
MDVVVKLKVEPEDGLTTKDVSAVKARLQTAIDTYWNGKHTLAVSDPRCGERRFPIRHKVEWVDAGHDYTMRIAAQKNRENVEGLIVNVWKETTVWTMAHEYAHCVGLPDEYTDDELAHEVVRYYRHDGLLDETEIIAVYIRPASDPDATILSTVDHAAVRLRHAWPIAIEAQEFLTAQLGRTIKCTVV